jgi:hypothetical protein
MTTHSQAFLDRRNYWIDRQEKQCITCRKIKSVSEFAKGDRARYDGFNPRCNECERVRHKEMYKNNPDPIKKSAKKWSQNNPEKTRAHVAINYALRTGKIKRPDTCVLCEEVSNDIVAHHWNGYDADHYLDVQWICRRCHNALSNH